MQNTSPISLCLEGHQNSYPGTQLLGDIAVEEPPPHPHVCHSQGPFTDTHLSVPSVLCGEDLGTSETLMSTQTPLPGPAPWFNFKPTSSNI